MTDAVTNDAFIKAKLANFIEFLQLMLKKRLHNTRFAEFTKKIEELQGIDTALFIVFVVEQMVPYRSNPSAYVDKLLAENEVKSSELAADETLKLCRYVTCFIDVVSSG